MQVEHIAGVGFTARGAAQQQRDGTVGHRVLGQIIVNDEHALALGHEVLGQCSARIGSDVLQRGRIRRGSCHDGGIAHSAVLFQILGHAGDGGSLLTDGNIDAQHILVLLVQDCIGSNGSLTGLAVADDQLTLTAADGEHGVDGQNTGVQRGVHALALQNTGCLLLNGVVALSLNGAFAVDGLAQRADDTAQKSIAHRNTGALAAAGDHGADADGLSAVEQHDAQLFGVHALHHALGTVFKGDDLAVHSAVHAINVHDAIGRGDNHTALCGGLGGLVVLDAGLEGSKRRLALHHFIQLMTAGIVEHAVAHLQDIAGKQALVHGDVQDDFRGVIELFDLGLDALQIFFPELMGTAQTGLDDAVIRKKFTTEFSCHCLHLLSAADRPAADHHPGRSNYVSGVFRTWSVPVP